MNIALTAISVPRTGASPPDARTVARNVAKSEKAARDFEALLLTPVLDSLQKTLAWDSEDGKTPGASDYRALGTQALAQAIADRGGIGIAPILVRHLSSPKVSGAD